MMATFPQLIALKRDGQEMSKEEIQQFVDGVKLKTLQESQIGSMLMAIYLNGMTPEETSHLTFSMMNSGEVLKWPKEWAGTIVDKHSTGGVGDKISLPLAPALAACGMKVPMITGRGLGHTGGTLDKLESIPGFNSDQTPKQMKNILEKVGCCMVGQTEELVPADKMLYAVRDVTGTVESIPLIVGSIISKKGAEGLNALVLDVKTGCGAVMSKEADARELARQMVKVGNSIGIKTTACLTNMDRPTGRMIGNTLEIVESIDCLHGKGPKDTVHLAAVEGGHLLYNVGKASSPEAGAAMIQESFSNGTAIAKFCELLKAQGVKPDIADDLCAKDADLFSILPKAEFITNVPASADGYVKGIHALKCGYVSFSLGAGRTKAGESVDHAVGLELHVSLGDKVKKGESWVTVHHNKPILAKDMESLREALTISPTPLTDINHSLLMDIIRSDVVLNSV